MFDYVIGLGQGGGRLAKEFNAGFGVQTVYMNLAGVDFHKMALRQEDLMIIEKGGTGRNPEYGESVVSGNINKMIKFLTNRGIESADHVLVAVGGGGGAGSGFLFPVLDYLTDSGKNVFLVFTLPEKREGIPTKPNALGTLNRIIENYMQKRSDRKISVLLVDNDFCIERYGNGKDWNYWGAVNSGIVTSLKRFWLLTQLDRFSNFVDISAGYKALDANDLRRVMFAKNGYTDLRMMTFKAPEYDALARYIKNSSLVFGSLDIRTTKRYVVSIGIPSSWKTDKRTGPFIEEVFATVAKMTRHTPDVLRTSYFNDRLKEMQVSLLLSGMARSSGIDKMIRGAEKDLERLESRGGVEKLNLKNVTPHSGI